MVLEIVRPTAPTGAADTRSPVESPAVTLTAAAVFEVSETVGRLEPVPGNDRHPELTQVVVLSAASTSRPPILRGEDLACV